MLRKLAIKCQVDLVFLRFFCNFIDLTDGKPGAAMFYDTTCTDQMKSEKDTNVVDDDHPVEDDERYNECDDNDTSVINRVPSKHETIADNHEYESEQGEEALIREVLYTYPALVPQR